MVQGRMNLRFAVAALATLLFLPAVSASAGDFDIYACQQINGWNFHCVSSDNTFVKGSMRDSSGGLGYFEGALNTAGGAFVKWFRVAVAKENPDRMQVQSGAAVVNYTHTVPPQVQIDVDSWLGGDAPVGDRLDSPLNLGGMCEKVGLSSWLLMNKSMDEFYSEVCLSTGGPSDSTIQELPKGLDHTLFNVHIGRSSEGQFSYCHMGRSTMAYFSYALGGQDCQSFEFMTATYPEGEGRVSCADGFQGEGYLIPASTLRFQGLGSLGIVATFGYTSGPLKGYRGAMVQLVSKHATGIKGVGHMSILDAASGGLMTTTNYTLNYVGPVGACDATKTRGFTPISRECVPDDAWGYVDPWAPNPIASDAASPEDAATGATKPNPLVFKCKSQAPDVLGEPSPYTGPFHDIEHHCLVMDSNERPISVSGSYGRYGFFEGSFINGGYTAHVNFLQVSTGGGKTELQTQSGAAVLLYSLGMHTSVSGRRMLTGSTSDSNMTMRWEAGTCEKVLDAAEAEHLCLSPPSAVPSGASAGDCTDMQGFEDSKGRTCDDYSMNPAWCEGSLGDGVYDPPGVYANAKGVDASQACCACKQHNPPLVGTAWSRVGVAPEPETEPMGELGVCSQGLNPVVPHSSRGFSPTCTKRMVDEKQCPLVPFSNRSLASNSLIFAGSSPGVLAIAGAYTDASGAHRGHLLLALTTPTELRGFACDHDAAGTMVRCSDVTFTRAAVNLACAETVKTTCVLRKDDGAKMVWPDLRAMRASQSFYTGGLGDLARKSPDKQYGVWACVKDWNATQQLYCGSGPGKLACFKYEDKSETFEFWGLNSDIRLVPTGTAPFTYV